MSVMALCEEVSNLEELLSSPVAHSIVPLLVVVLVAALTLKAAKGCIKFLIVIILIAVLMIYVIPTFLL